MVISNEHPEALERMAPDSALEPRARGGEALRGAKRMRVTSPGGSDLDVDMAGAPTVGIWGWTEKPGTLAHWPGGIVVSFPKAGGVNGTLVLDRGNVNLTFKRYLEAPVRLTLESDYVTQIEGEGADAEMFRSYLAAWGDRNAYAVSHVGFGLNPKARYEALTMYDQRDTNGTEIRAVSGNFLFSTGANEFAGRYTAGHFDMPVMRTTITVDGMVVVKDGVVQDVFGKSLAAESPATGAPGNPRVARPAASPRDKRLQPFASIRLDIEPLVIEETRPSRSPRRPSRHVALDDLRRGVALAAERAGEIAARVIEDVAAAPVDEFQHAENGETEAEAVLDRLVDVLGACDAFLDHARGLVHRQRLDARHDVARPRRAHDRHLADGSSSALTRW